MQPVLGLIEDDRVGGVHHVVGDFVAAVRGKAVHEQRVRAGGGHQRFVDLDTARKMRARVVGLVLLAHRRPHVGVDRVGAGDGGDADRASP